MQTLSAPYISSVSLSELQFAGKRGKPKSVKPQRQESRLELPRHALGKTSLLDLASSRLRGLMVTLAAATAAVAMVSATKEKPSENPLQRSVVVSQELASAEHLNVPSMSLAQLLGMGPISTTPPKGWSKAEVATMQQAFEKNTGAYLQLLVEKSGVSNIEPALNEAFSQFSDVETRLTINAFQELVDTKDADTQIRIMDEWTQSVLKPHLTAVVGTEKAERILWASTTLNDERNPDSNIHFNSVVALQGLLGLLTLAIGGIAWAVQPHGTRRKAPSSLTALGFGAPGSTVALDA